MFHFCTGKFIMHDPTDLEGCTLNKTYMESIDKDGDY